MMGKNGQEWAITGNNGLETSNNQSGNKGENRQNSSQNNSLDETRKAAGWQAALGEGRRRTRRRRYEPP
jgi:hypothetical protein